MEPWRKTLVMLWLAQLLSSAGFSFAVPFVPYYFQDMGVKDAAALKLWVALFGAALPLTMALIAPVWGAISDRYGRRLMALRACGAGVVILVLMGLARSPAQLIALRLVQGLFTGTMTALQTMASVSTPSDRGGLALGALSSAAFSGAMLGGFLGGIMADMFGFRPSFFLAGGLLLVSMLCILFGTSEEARPVPAADEPRKGPPVNGVLAGLPILLLLAFMAMVRMFDSSFLPLLVQEIHGKLEGASVRSGTLAAAGAVAGMIAGVVMGRLADRLGPPAVGRLSAVGAALLMIPQGLAHSFLMLLGARSGMVFFAGGLDPVFLIWLSRTTPKDQRGVVFGWAATAKSVGWFLAPLASGAVAAGFGVRSIYAVGAALFLLLVPGIQLTVRRLQRTAGADARPTEARPASPASPRPAGAAAEAGPTGSSA